MRIKKGYKYQLPTGTHILLPIKGVALEVPGFLKLHESGLLEISAGYAWDGPSGPTFDNPKTLFPSLVHDAIYQLDSISEEHDLKEIADWIFYRLMQVNRNGEIKSRVWYWAVSNYGDPKPRKSLDMPTEMPDKW